MRLSSLGVWLNLKMIQTAVDGSGPEVYGSGRNALGVPSGLWRGILSAKIRATDAETG